MPFFTFIGPQGFWALAALGSAAEHRLLERLGNRSLTVSVVESPIKEPHMDAHVFRLVSRILCLELQKARIERIHEPVPDVTALSFFASGKKQCLILRAHRSSPLLFLTGRSPLPNPAFPPARVMRLRKYAEGRILGEGRVDWASRRLAFALPGPAGSESWLLLDCKYGCAILSELPENFAAEPVWPPASDIPSEFTAMDEESPWQRFQVLTPALRRTLAYLAPQDAAALLVDLEGGGGDLFWYGSGETPCALSAWPLPPQLRQIGDTRLWEKATPPQPDLALPLLASLQLPLLLEAAKAAAGVPARKIDKAASKKRKRLITNLTEEKKRLEAMLRLGDDARLLQANLWRFAPEERLETVTLPVCPDNPGGDQHRIELNPLISLTENMQAMFRKATRASRGMAMLEKRMALARETPAPTSTPAVEAMTVTSRKSGGKKPLFTPSLIQEFISSDGFTLWRGRNAEGNRNLLKLARPFDLWFHVEDGPSAHLLLRRDHAAQEVPERTMEEAAILTGIKSWRKYDPKAPVMVALAKHVQAIKGAPAGTVRVQETVRTILAVLDESLEERLRRKGSHEQ